MQTIDHRDQIAEGHWWIGNINEDFQRLAADTLSLHVGSARSRCRIDNFDASRQEVTAVGQSRRTEGVVGHKVGKVKLIDARSNLSGIAPQSVWSRTARSRRGAFFVNCDAVTSNLSRNNTADKQSRVGGRSHTDGRASNCRKRIVVRNDGQLVGRSRSSRTGIARYISQQRVVVQSEQHQWCGRVGDVVIL